MYDFQRGRAGGPRPRADGICKELSAVLGKIIDQLSLSAWMPGLALVGGLALLIAMRESASNGFPDVSKTFERLANLSLGGALVLLISVMLATVVAQAFEFEMIKLAEGYWGNGPLSRRLRSKKASRHATRLRDLQQQKKRLEKEAIKGAIPRMAPKNPELTSEIKRLWKAQRAKAEPSVAPSSTAAYLLEGAGVARLGQVTSGQSRPARQRSGGTPASIDCCPPGWVTPCGLPRTE